MRIVCIGGGPAGLFFSIVMKTARPGAAITVFERNRPNDTFGWGVVFSDQTLGNIAAADPITYERIVAEFVHWDDIDIHYRGRTIRAGGQGFAGIARKKLLQILQERARELGVDLRFETEATEADKAGADVAVIADGANSAIRRAHAQTFGTTLQHGRNRYIWLGTHQRFDAFTFAFERTEHGWFQVHAYQFDADTGTVIVECREETWRAAGLDAASVDESLAFCERLFAPYLGGHGLMSNARHLANPWIGFVLVDNARWYDGNRVLIGDAAHTAHFSIGSGTKLALEDAIGLARALDRNPERERAFAEYEAERRIEVLRLQNAARNSTEWFENVARYASLEPEQFAYSLLTRSQRLGHDNLRLRDRAYVDSLEAWLARSAGAERPVPPMFTPLRLRALELRNRVVVSPMAMYSCVDGTPNDFYLVHLGARAQGGAGLVFTEMTCVAPDARISPGCAGMYRAEHVAGWTRIVDFVHAYTDAKIALQLGHAGPKGSTQRGWEEPDEPLRDGNWPLLGPSPIAFGERNQIPRAMTRDDMDRVKAQFVRAAEMGAACGFDLLELHCAHGYLLSSFITPLTNQRTDAYGGTLENCLRYPLEVFAALRAVWPAHLPMSVRISATDWVPGGITPDDALVVARAFHDAGADLIDVSAGQTSRAARPVYGRMFQTPFSDAIRNELGIATMAVGNITDADMVNGIIASGRADLVALARPHLADPYFTLHAAAQLGYDEQRWPNPYLPGREQLLRTLRRTAALAEVTQ
ncbi:bifunctional salicylyl-CoA 5-hydroxylase/oxidoreductase [Vulcanimicrobium alpinum]|uniref:bifunctional salicylyl-CoA 5-hydroxylase/oxidoreductase n=1 Tax=Vulcanimicrobium alpinum TaxID=3016050 RepID=UPI00295F1CBB|nr:bifunctional salicylyl-CoA 5-hydroxylase/oxidoreductase [Vulcanimicrobium alpinum]